MNEIIKKQFTLVFLALYAAIGFLPSFSAIDKIGPQFVYLSFLNFFTFIYIFKNKLFQPFVNKKESLFKIIFSFWLLFGFWGIFSAVYAFNTSEVLIESSRVFIYIFSLFNITILLQGNKFKLESIVPLLAIIVLIESFWVLKSFIELSSFKILSERSLQLKSFTGNINITAFTMVLKTPFLILYLYRLNRVNLVFRMIPLLIVMLAIFLLGSRGANLTLILIISSLVLLAIFKKKILSRLFAVSILTTFAICIGINAVQFNQSKGLNFIKRTSTYDDQSTNERIRFYTNALESIKENPIKGIGIGNWKIASIKFDGPDVDTYRVPYHVHNDFLEVTAELGLIGFILFFGIYPLLFFRHYKFFRSKKIPNDSKLLGFIMLLGLMVYLSDSFLNFPFTRPVMQVPNLIMIASSLVIFSQHKLATSKGIKLNIPTSSSVLLIIASLIFIPTSWISIKVYNSLVEQRFLLTTIAGDYTDYSLDRVSQISSDIPNISAATLPIDAIKAALFMRKDSIEVLNLIERGIRSNPFIGYGELLKSSYFIETNNLDSAFYYGKKVYKKLPKQINHFNHYMNLIQVSADTLALKEVYNDLNENTSTAKYEKYLQVAGKIKQNIGLSEREILNKLSLKNPNNSFDIVFKVLGEIGRENIKNGVYYASLGEKEFTLKNYNKAANLFLEAANYNPLEKAYHENAANALMKINENRKAIEVLEKMISDLDPKDGKAEYLIGIIYLDEKQREKACTYLRVSKKKGFKFPEQILTRFCG